MQQCNARLQQVLGCILCRCLDAFSFSPVRPCAMLLRSLAAGAALCCAHASKVHAPPRALSQPQHDSTLHGTDSGLNATSIEARPNTSWHGLGLRIASNATSREAQAMLRVIVAIRHSPAGAEAHTLPYRTQL